MKKYIRLPLNQRLSLISMGVFLPMLLLVVYLLFSLQNAADAYSDITTSVTYANRYNKAFKARMDYSAYLAVISGRSMDTMGNGEITVNGIETVNPYEYIPEMEAVCDQLSDMATVRNNRAQIQLLKNSLSSLKKRVTELDKRIRNKTGYDENMTYLDENIYMLTGIIQEGIQDYIYEETTNFANVRASLDEKNRQLYYVTVIIAVCAVGMAFLLTRMAAKSVTKPIRKLCDLTNKVAEGDFTVKTKVENRDEIAALTSSFNDMTQEIGMLVEDIRTKQQNLHIAETRLLQEQINPHFLYNTLDTIVWLAEADKKEEVVAMVTSLSDFFRTTLSKGREFITIREEEQHIRSYLEIQQFRYQDILDYEISISPELYDYVLPKLTLQPLVENALYHGIKNKRGKGMIRITGQLYGGNIVLQVSDNGKGMSEEALKKLRESLERSESGSFENEDPGGFGLVNVKQRIQYYYGEGYGLTFESRENVGTTATIVIDAKNIPPFS